MFLRLGRLYDDKIAGLASEVDEVTKSIERTEVD